MKIGSGHVGLMIYSQVFYHMSEFTHEHYLACVACVLEISKLAHKFYSRHTGGHKCNCKLSLELYHNYMPLIFATLLVIQFQPIGFDIWWLVMCPLVALKYYLNI